MGIRQLKPVTPASRFTSRPDFSEITTDKPEKSLVRKLKKTGGRNNNGRITSRRRGGGHKRSYRIWLCISPGQGIKIHHQGRYSEMVGRSLQAGLSRP